MLTVPALYSISANFTYYMYPYYINKYSHWLYQVLCLTMFFLKTPWDDTEQNSVFLKMALPWLTKFALMIP